MDTGDEERRKRIWYIAVGAVLALLIAWLWIRYAANQRLLSQLDSRDMEVRVAACGKLLESGSLADSLPAQPVKRRESAAGALGKIATDKAMAQLVVLIKDPEDLPQKAASRALAGIGVGAIPHLLPLLKEGDARAKKATVEAFERIGVEAVPDLSEALDNPDRRGEASKALARIKGPAIPPLLQAAQSDDMGLRKVGIVALGEAKDKPAVPIILPALEEPDLQQAAIRALGLIADSRATADIIPFLDDAKLRIDAATALGQISDGRATGDLIAHLRQRETQFRERLTWALKRIGEPAVAELAAALHSPDVWVRRGAAQALTTAQVAQANPPLMAALQDRDIEVRAAAAQGLGWPDNTAAIRPLLAAVDDPDWRVVDAALASLAEIGDPAVSALVATLAHADILKAYHASRTLAEMGRSSVPALIVQLSSLSEQNRKWAAVTLGEIGDKEAVEPLKKMLSSPSEGERYVAKKALSRMGIVEESEL